MSIDEVYKINTNVADETSTVKKAFSSIAEQAVGAQYIKGDPDLAGSDVPTQVPSGKVVIYDNGTIRRLYVNTNQLHDDGSGNLIQTIGYVTLTII